MKKIVVSFVFMLLILTALPAVGMLNKLDNDPTSNMQNSGVEWSSIHNYESEFFEDCNIQHVETLSQLFNCATFDDDLDNIIIDYMNRFHIPGLSASIVKDGNVFWTGSYGYANISQSIYVQDTTLFYLASVSKTITGVAMMQLYEQGYFVLNDPINDFLPFQVIHPDYPSTDITFHMLLTHTSGITDNQDFIHLYAGDSPNPLGTWLEDYLTPGGQYYDPDENFLNSEPGTDREYCNTAVGLVGFLVEVISEVPFDEYCKVNIFEPLEMDMASWFLKDLDINNIAVPYIWNGYEYDSQPHWGRDYYPASTLRTSIKHLNNFLMMMMNKGEHNSTQILEESTVNLILSPQLPFEDQGIIWYKDSFGGRTFWRHDGSLPGVKTAISIFPETNNGVIVLTNGDNYIITNKVSDALFDYVEKPYVLSINGPRNGKIGIIYDYEFSDCVDPDGDDMTYHVEWGDGGVDEGFVASGGAFTLSHTWDDKGDYVIKAKLIDDYGAESDWATFDVNIPRTKTLFNHLFQDLFSRFTNLLPLLQILMKRL
jgi:CubicO group peptidase (beta-lactamase class C family)